MVSFWPFKGGDDTSAASFEKALSQLSTKINKASAQNDGLRQHQRRFKALWTLYSSFVYILVALILTLVTGWEQWGPGEYSAIASGPVLIYGIRLGLDTYYNYRVSHSQNHLNDLYKRREATIEKLKAATKYNSTQQLLDKYGGTPKKRQPSPKPPKKRQSEGPQSNQSTPQGPRTGFMPPPTANIPGRQLPPPGPMTPDANQGHMPAPPPQDPSLPQPQNDSEPNEEFAPNAFSAPVRPPTIRQPSTQYATDGPKWYDRILDVVLGEDETSARNRIALICASCKLVNGQAPPGVRTLEEVGKWRCSACHAMNGVEAPEHKMLKQISGQQVVSPTSPDGAVVGTGLRSDEEEEEDDEDEDEDSGEEEPATGSASSAPPARSTRSKARQRKKGI